LIQETRQVRVDGLIPLTRLHHLTNLVKRYTESPIRR
jgi:hypothetical protein